MYKGSGQQGPEGLGPCTGMSSVAQNPAGGMLLLVYPRNQYWVHSCLISPLKVGMMVQSEKLSSVADDKKPWGVGYVPGGCAAIQRELGRQENWAERNFIRFNKGEMQSPATWGGMAPCSSTCWKPAGWKAALQRGTVASLVAYKLPTSQQYTLMSKAAIPVLGCMKHFCQCWWKASWNAVSSSGLPQYKWDMDFQEQF